MQFLNQPIRHRVAITEKWNMKNLYAEERLILIFCVGGLRGLIMLIIWSKVQCYSVIPRVPTPTIKSSSVDTIKPLLYFDNTWLVLLLGPYSHKEGFNLDGRKSNEFIPLFLISITLFLNNLKWNSSKTSWNCCTLISPPRLHCGSNWPDPNFFGILHP